MLPLLPPGTEQSELASVTLHHQALSFLWAPSGLGREQGTGVRGVFAQQLFGADNGQLQLERIHWEQLWCYKTPGADFWSYL